MKQLALDDTRDRYLARAGHLLALILILGPAAGFVLAASVPGPEGAFGRARAFTLIVDGGLWPLMGLFLGSVVAVLFLQRSMRWVYAVTSTLLGLLLVLLVPFFILDVLQLHKAVRPEVLRLYEANAVRNLIALSAYGLCLLLLGIGGIRSLHRDRPAALEPSAALVRNPKESAAERGAR